MQTAIDRDIVIGSGPAGVAVASVLVKQGRRVMMVDVGEQIEPEREALRARLAAVEPDEWDPADVGLARAPSHSGEHEGILPFGSDVLFRDPVGLATGEGQDSIGFKPSFAKGGMSNGWGASVLPYRAEDLKAWPIGARELSPHYKALSAFVPMAARQDDLAELFPMVEVKRDTSLPLSSQAERLLSRMGHHRDRLKQLGIHFGKARQAVLNDCRECAMCLYGCPYHLIFNASSVVERLSESGRIEYLPGHYVVRFEESEAGVRIWSRDLREGGIVEHQGRRLFVAAGVLSTAKIVLNSIGTVDEPILMNDSQHFFLPMLHRWWPRPDPASEPRHTLTQLFVLILDPAVSKNTVHFQLYTHNDFYAADMRHRFGSVAGLMKPVIAQLSRRLIVAQGFLHSDESAKVEIRLTRSGDEPRLRFKPVVNPETQPAVRRAVARMRKAAFGVGLVPLVPLHQSGSVGSSFHCGGTFPMCETPQGRETDKLGRLVGLRRVFLVDASTFPSIPATTISLSIMANAHRIATAALEAG